MEPCFFESASELRLWFQMNHETEKVLWVGIYKKESGQQTLTWEEASDEALCFGWVESKIRKMSQITYAVKYTPRKKGALWSKNNVKKARMLIDTGLMEPAGIQVFQNRAPDADTGLNTLADQFLTRLQHNALAWSFFQTLSKSVKENSVKWVVRGKKEETREKRFLILLQSCEEGQKIPPLRIS